MNMKTNKQNSFLHTKWIICFTFATLCLEFYKSAVYLFFSLSDKQKIDLKLNLLAVRFFYNRWEIACI